MDPLAPCVGGRFRHRDVTSLNMRRIYLDNNATTFLDPLVREAIDRIDARCLANPASQHADGQAARAVLEDSRDAICAALGAGRDDRLVFTSGATESNHLALLGMAGSPPATVLISSVEHPCLQGATSLLRERGFTVAELPVDRCGRIDPGEFSRRLTPQVCLVSVIYANHETGVIQPIEQLAAICRSNGIPFHTDAAQAVGKLPIEFAQLGVDAMSIAPHKFHGPVGIGGLLLRKGLPLVPLFRGGFQQAGLRPGTESVGLAVGFRVALEQAVAVSGKQLRTLSQLRDGFEAGLAGRVPIVVHGSEALRVPQTSCISFPGADRQRLFLALDLAGISCSTGSACASGSSEPSPILQAMGVAEELIGSALRFSFARTNSLQDVSEAIDRIVAVCWRN
ncbi:MAG: cysteine desulfurase [Planctomycetes bacterium]|nr:cysteine desulfurase [Planctomycetota bacterium]